GAARRRRGHGDRDDPDDRGRDERRPGRQGRRRLRRAEQHAAGGRLARRRDLRRDPRLLRELRRRLPGRPPRRGRDRARRGARRVRPRPGAGAPARGRGRAGMSARLPASERRAAVLDTACRVFARCSYRGATTAQIAREAGVTEPILYRHFSSKQALYLACIDSARLRVRRAWDEAVAAEPDPRAWTQAMANAFFDFREQRSAVAQLWLQALTESGDDPEIRRYLRRHLRDVHGFVAEVVRRCQAAGAIPPERD